MENNNILKSENRRRIYNFILKYLGTHLNEFSKKIEYSKKPLCFIR